MGTFYDSCVNFRDVGEALELVSAKSIFPQQRLFRGGKIDFVTEVAPNQVPASIVNLRQGADPELLDTSFHHFPKQDSFDVYDTTSRAVNLWLGQVINLLASESLAFPVLIHCAAGKDRTGVVVAAVLAIVEIDRSHIVDEYLLSEGHVEAALIENAIEGFGQVDNYFKDADINGIRNNFGKS